MRTLSGSFSNQEGGKNSTDSIHARHHVNPGNTHLCGGAILLPSDGHDPTSRLHGEVKSGLVSPGTVLPVARNTANNCLLRRFSKVPLKCPRFEVFNDDISLSHQRLDSSRFFLDICRDDDLAAVG